MSQENVDVVRRLYDEFLSDPDRALNPAGLRFFGPDVEIVQSAVWKVRDRRVTACHVHMDPDEAFEAVSPGPS